MPKMHNPASPGELLRGFLGKTTATELARQIGDITSDTAFIVLLALSGLNIQY